MITNKYLNKKISNDKNSRCLKSYDSLQRPCKWRARGPSPRVVLCHDGKAGKEQEGQPQVVSESVLSRLRAAEEEAARLRAQLEASQAEKGAVPIEEIEEKPRRFDGMSMRETILAPSQPPSWLNEADVEFFTGSNTPSESSVTPRSQQDPEANAIVQRRLLIGAVLSAGALAFALVPTEALRSKPSKPLYFYIIPLLRVKALLEESSTYIEDADWAQLRVLLDRLEGSPNFVQANIGNVVACLAGNPNQGRVQELGFEFLDYLRSMDFNSYFESLPNKAPSGTENLRFVNFSRSAQAAALQRLNALLSLLPSDELDAAYGRDST